MLINYIKRKVLGYSLPQEYACLALQEFEGPLHVVVTVKGSTDFLDVSDSHLFLGYKPLVIGITLQHSSNFPLSESEEICLTLYSGEFRSNIKWHGFLSSDQSPARIILKKKQVLACGEHKVWLFEGVYAKHKFISTFNQFVNKQKEKRRSDRKVNINLSENLADQVQAAYAIPRSISIITLSDNNNMNMFPTDLHGQVNAAFYVGSLRHGGKANEQVEHIKKIVISQVDFTWYKRAYALGKNHMRDLMNEKSFPIANKRSRVLNSPLPESAASYHELNHLDSVDIGIHRIHRYQILNSEKINDAMTLAHIHRFYAQWRIDNGKSTKFYWR